MNCVILIGRLVRDPELSYTTNGKAVCKFVLAVDRGFSNGEKEADFINIVVWGKVGENCAEYLSKGRKAAVEGRLQIRSYEDNSGKRKYVTEVVAGKVEFLEFAGENKKVEDFGIEVELNEEDCPF